MVLFRQDVHHFRRKKREIAVEYGDFRQVLKKHSEFSLCSLFMHPFYGVQVFRISTHSRHQCDVKKCYFGFLIGCFE